MSGLRVLLFQAALVAVIYWPTLRLDFASDAWSYLLRLRQGAWAAVATPIGYHWQPVACAWIAAIRALFGERPAAFQAVNLLELTLIGHLTFRLGLRLLADARAAVLGSALVLGSAAFYECSYWPLAGNMHFLAALLYVLSVVVACDVASGRWGRGGPWMLGLTTLLAVFSHPAMVTSVPVCALALLLLRRPRPGHAVVGRAGPARALLPLAAVALLFVAARVGFQADFHAAPRAGLEPVRVVWLIRSGLFPVFTLRGSLDFLVRLLTFGIPAQDAATVWSGVLGWLLLCAMATLAVWRTGGVGVRLVVAFLAIHLAALAVASGLSPRQSVVPSVPAALLTAWALCAVAGRLAARFAAQARPTLARTLAALPLVAGVSLMSAGMADHGTARRLHLRVAKASRALAARLREIPPEQGRFPLTLINMPASLVERGIGAFAFQNGLGEMAHITNPAVLHVDLWRIPIRGAPEHIVAEVPWLARTALREQLADPHRVVLLYEDEPADVRRITASDWDSLAARWIPPD